MTWKPDMDQEERDRLNASRRKQYRNKRLRQGKTYKGETTASLEHVDYFLSLVKGQEQNVRPVYQKQEQPYCMHRLRNGGNISSRASTSCNITGGKPYIGELGSEFDIS